MTLLHGHPVPVRTPPPLVTWSVGGEAVEMEWDSFDSSAPGGYGMLRSARVLPRKGRRVPMHQGQRVEGRHRGKICYQGKLTAPPKYVDHVGIITADGPKTEVQRYTDRLSYQIRDTSAWQQLDADPAHYVMSEKFNIQSKGKALGVIRPVGPTFANGNRAGFYIFVQDQPIQRIAFTIRKTADFGALELVVAGGNNLGALTDEVTYNLDATNADGTAKSRAISPNYDTIALFVRATGAATPTTQDRVWVEDLRIGVITAADTFTTADVAADVAARCSYASETSGAVNVLPLDWTGAATDLLDYVAAIEDSTWLVMHSRNPSVYGKLYFRDWGRKTWHTRLDGMAEDSGLEVLPLYDGVTTEWESTRGLPHSKHSRAADFGLADPLPGQTVDYPEPMSIEDPQPDSTLALAMNQRALQRLTKPRLRGSVLVRSLVPPGVPYDIDPGDLLDIGDFQPRVPPQRIASATYYPDGTVSCDLERDLHLDQLVRRVHRGRRRHRSN